MTKLWILCALPTLALFPQGSKEPEVVAERTYTSPDGVVLEGLGGCEESVETVECWDMDGKPNADLSERARAYYLTQPNNPMQFTFRKKNRLVVLRRKGLESVSISVSSGGRSMGSAFSIYGPGGENLEFYRIAAEPGEKSTALTVTMSRMQQPIRADLPLRAGARVNVEGDQFEFVDITPAKIEDNSRGFNSSWMMNTLGKGPVWQIQLALASEIRGNNDMVHLLGKDGRPIQYVDAKGEPVSAAEYLKSMPRGEMAFRAQSSSKYRTAQVMFNYSGFPGQGVSYFTNVNPKAATALGFSRYPKQTVRLTGFPLDPVSKG